MKKIVVISLSILCALISFSEETQELKTKKEIKKQKAFIGVTLKQVIEDNVTSGVIVMDVFEDSAADLAGLISNDMIIKIDGKDIGDIKEIKALLAEMNPDQNIQIFVERGNETKTIELKLGEEPLKISMEHFGSEHRIHKLERIHKKAFFIGEPRPFIGIQLKTLQGQLAGYFGVDSGILIEDVTEDSPAFAAGIQAGDVITGVNDLKMTQSKELLDFLDNQKPGDEITLIIMRKEQQLEFPIVLGENTGKDYFFLHGDGDEDVQILKWIDEENGEIKIELKTVIEKEN